jgi:hypothetical protein
LGLSGPPPATGSGTDPGSAAPVAAWYFPWLTVAATGGPLAIAAVYLPGVLGDERSSAVVVVAAAVILFVPAIIVWTGYSGYVVGPGGLSGFVAAAAGRWTARVQALLWIVSYALYLVYTTTQIAYEVLPSVWPASAHFRPLMQVGTAVLVGGVALLPLRRAAQVVTVVAGAQLLLIVGLAWAESSLGTAAAGYPSSPRATLVAGGNVAILFVCASLPIFLGAEFAGTARTVRRGLRLGWAVAAAATLVAAVPLARVVPDLLGTSLPGMSVAAAAGAPRLATAIGVGVVAAVAAVMVAEYLALTRLLHWLSGVATRTISRIVAVLLVAGSVVTLLQPERIYEDLLKPSLVALWLSQLVVFVCYPLFVARRRQHTTGQLAVATGLGAVASALMLFGLWSTIVNQLGT